MVAGSGTGVADGGTALALALGAADEGVTVASGVGLGLGVACPTVPSVVLRLETKRPTITAARIVPMTAPMLTSESRSVGKRPVGVVRDWPRRSGTPQDRQTWAHSGFARPQLKHSTDSSVMWAFESPRSSAGWLGGESLARRVAAGGENADGLRSTSQQAGRGPVYRPSAYDIAA